MLRVDDPTLPPDAATLDRPGAFTWWYADGIDAQGDGLVLIAAWALPFWPGDRAARAAGHRVRPRERPTLNIAAYRGGRLASYTLLGVAPERASWSPEAWVLGDSRLRLERGGDAATLVAELDLPVPGRRERLTGTVRCEGPLADGGDADPPDASDHGWAPLLGPARMTAALDVGGRSLLRLDGSGYHDRNTSGAPLDELGIDRWTWGRQVFGDTLVVHYLTWPSDPAAPPTLLAVIVGPDGRRRVLRDLPVEVHGPRRTWLGMPWWERIVVHVDGDPLEVVHAPPTDSGPFYLRFQTRSAWRGRRAHGWAELCLPDRIDGPVMRPLVRMCVQQERGPQSAWLPLFAGPSADRWARLLGWWAGGRRAPRALP